MDQEHNERHHHHATVKAVTVFHGGDQPTDYLLTEYNQTSDEPCNCDLIDPWKESE